MNKTAEKRATAYVRRLRKGDKFRDFDGVWEVSREPVVKGGKEVTIGLLPIPPKPGVNRYTRTFIYDIDARVKIVR